MIEYWIAYDIVDMYCHQHDLTDHSQNEIPFADDDGIRSLKPGEGLKMLLPGEESNLIDRG